MLRLVQSDTPNLRDRVYYVPNFSDLSPHQTAHSCDDRADEVIGKAKRDGRLVVLVPRNLTFKQGIALLPAVVETLQVMGDIRCQFVVTGQFVRDLPQSAQFERRLRRAIEAMAAAARDRLTLLYGVRHECMPRFYECADVVLFPSFASEGTPLSAIEAMMFGKAIVATNIGGLNDLIDSGHTGVLVRPIAEEIAEAIATLARDAELRAQLGSAAKNKAERQFSLAEWRAMVVPFMERNGWLLKS